MGLDQPPRYAGSDGLTQAGPGRWSRSRRFHFGAGRTRVSFRAVNKLLAGLLGALVTLGQLSAATNGAVPAADAAVAIPDPNDPVEKEYKQLMADDDAAQGEVDQWLRDNEKFTAEGAGVPGAEMSRRIRQRLAPIRSAYEDFIPITPARGSPMAVS